MATCVLVSGFPATTGRVKHPAATPPMPATTAARMTPCLIAAFMDAAPRMTQRDGDTTGPGIHLPTLPHVFALAAARVPDLSRAVFYHVKSHGGRKEGKRANHSTSTSCAGPDFPAMSAEMRQKCHERGRGRRQPGWRSAPA